VKKLITFAMHHRCPSCGVLTKSLIRAWPEETALDLLRRLQSTTCVLCGRDDLVKVRTLSASAIAEQQRDQLRKLSEAYQGHPQLDLPFPQSRTA